MILRITSYSDLDKRKLMDIYAESNFENTEYFYPDETDKKVALNKVESGFLDFLKEEFFKQTKATYWVLEKDGMWVCALRTCEIQPGLYYLEALETNPGCRQNGYGSFLLSGVLEIMKADGSFRLCDCVSKRNTASLKTHDKCGFQIVSEEGYDYLHDEADKHDFGLEFRYLAE